MANGVQIAAGTTFEFEGNKWLIHSRTEDGKWNAYTANENKFREFTVEELDRHWLKKELRFTGDVLAKPIRVITSNTLAPMDTYSPEERAIAMRKHEYFCAVYKAKQKRKPKRPGKRFNQPYLQEVFELRKAEGRLLPDEVVPGMREFSRFAKTYDESGQVGLPDVRIFLPRWKRCGNRTSRFDSRVDEIVDQTARALTMQKHPASAEEIHGQILARVENEVPVDDVEERYKAPDGSVRIPCVQTVQRHINAFDRGDVLETQKDKRARDLKYRFVERGPVEDRPMAFVEIDSTTWDILVIDYKYGIPLGRPTLTIAKCRFTRQIVGMYISFSGPSGYAVGRCLYNAMIPKYQIVEELGLKKPWYPHGLVGMIGVDEGVENGDQLLENTAQLGIDVQKMPPASPRHKARIERQIGTMMRAVAHKIPGTTFSNVIQKGDYKSADMACIALSHLNYIAHKFAVEIHNERYHNGIFYYPNQKWLETPYDQLPGRPAILSDLDLLLCTVKRARITRNGIRLFGLTYADNRSLSALRLLTRPDADKKVLVRVDEMDLSKIWVWDHIKEEYFSLPCIFTEYVRDGMTRRAHNFIANRARARAKRKGRLSIMQLIQAKWEIREIVKTLAERRKYSNKKLRNLFNSMGDVETGDTHLETVEMLKEERAPQTKTTARKKAKQSPKTDLDVIEANFDLQEQALDAEIEDDDVGVED